MEDFSQAALVLAGHGSTLSAESSLPVYQHAGEIRRRKIFGQVAECFWKQEPAVCAVMRGIFARRVFVVPLFLGEGYFTRQVIPRELGLSGGKADDFPRVQNRNGRTLLYCDPPGAHESMAAAVLSRARNVVMQFPFPRAPQPSETSLFIAAHGTSGNENSRKAAETQAERIRALGLYADVHAVFLEEEPRVSDCHDLAGTRHIVVVPFFVSDGPHSREDIPVMLGETEENTRARMRAGQPTWRNPSEKKGRLVWYAPSIGSEPGLADVILERVRETGARNP